MTFGYDLELMNVALDNVENAARNLVVTHPLEDWFLYRAAHIRAEAKSLKNEITKMKGESWEKFT